MEEAQRPDSMELISVGLPTARRPELLRSALRSIANQSRPDLIAEVLVSENGLDERSRLVCEEFPNLPIRYSYRTAQLSPGDHFVTVVEELRTDCVALLGDDDMWGRYHLEEARRALEENPDAVGYVTQAAVVENESRQVVRGYQTPLASLTGPQCHAFAPYWRWSPQDVLLNSLIHTPLNLWGFVCRRQPLLVAMECFRDPDCGYDSDRFFFWQLARQGPLVVGREVGLFYRVHAEGACVKILSSEARDWHERKGQEYTEQMTHEAEADGIDWRQLWTKTWADLSPRDQVRVWDNGLLGAQTGLRNQLGSTWPWRRPTPNDAATLLPNRPFRSGVGVLLTMGSGNACHAVRNLATHVPPLQRVRLLMQLGTSLMLRAARAARDFLACVVGCCVSRG